MTGPFRFVRCSSAFDLQGHEGSGERQNPRRETYAAEKPRQGSSIPGREVDSGSGFPVPGFRGSLVWFAGSEPDSRTRNPEPGTPEPATKEPGTPEPVSMSARRSPTVFAVASAVSSSVVWNTSSSAIISSTLSSDVNPNSSIVVSGVMSRPEANRAHDRLDRRARGDSGFADDSPAAQRWISRRLSFCVPSVRGSASPGQIDVLQTR